MFQKADDRGPPVSLRGWLSDVYVPALLDKANLKESHEQLARRLGPRAGVDDPLFGRAAGLAEIETQIGKLSEWLLERGAIYERQHFTTGVDRDVTEGVIALSLEQKTVELPVAVVAEKRRSREVELRLYFSTMSIRGSFVARPQLVPPVPDLPIPPAVANFLEAQRQGSVEGLLGAFDNDGTLRDARGLQHGKGSGALREYFDKLLAGGAFGGAELSLGGAADDGRTSALEYTLLKHNGRDVTPQAGLALFERGDSGLLRAVRLYDDVES